MSWEGVHPSSTEWQRCLSDLRLLQLPLFLTLLPPPTPHLLPSSLNRYIHDDPGLVPLLEMLRQSGKKLFVATNSLW